MSILLVTLIRKLFESRKYPEVSRIRISAIEDAKLKQIL